MPILPQSPVVYSWTARQRECVPCIIVVSGARNTQRDRMSGGSPKEEREGGWVQG